MDQTIDLYEGLKVPSKTKRHEREEKEAKEQEERKLRLNESITENELTKRKKQRTEGISIEITLKKLSKHIQNDTKYIKANELFIQCIDTYLLSENVPLFISTLQQLIVINSNKWSGKESFQQLITHLLQKQEIILAYYQEHPLNDNESITNILNHWKIVAITHYQLFTDDTYQFMRAAKQVKVYLEKQLQEFDNQDLAQSEACRNWLHQCMPILRTIYTKHTIPWAKTMVETILNISTKYRLQFHTKDRQEIDKWTTSIRERQSQPLIQRSIASEARRNVQIQTNKDTLEANRKTVGKTNHPLRNQR